jgi:hypothetical protein
MSDSTSNPDMLNELAHKRTVCTGQQTARLGPTIRYESGTIRLPRATILGFRVAKESNPVIRS